MIETGKNWHKKLPPTLYAYAGANIFNSSCFKVSDKVDNGIIKEAPLDFYTSSEKKKPDQIIIFRERVSESQFNQVLIKLLRLASSLARCGTLKIGSPDNVLHGTVIDNKVCHLKNNDFYLGTHARMIGITRQTHYHVLLDQAGFSADDLKEFVHSLSYMYQRSTTAIFVVPPICYTHLAASQLGAIYED
ncbi:Protein argonaute 4 -like protein [Gossypium arboreum]|uniref:Protein argonaute 4-like protein n=1 Tax=Gossypium arboreum TaxID=29729 RepID=A0A0B0N6G2_GOSAR|nr:Protein argonaute 4 -like protein [Gossypium arboreum]